MSSSEGPNYRAPLAAFREASALDPVALARIRARLERPPRPRSSGWLVGACAGGLVAAVSAMVWMPSVGRAWMSTSPQPVSVPLGTTANELALTPDVVAAVEGEGKVEGDTKNLHVRWESGRISLEVTPEQGVDLEVTTDEGVIHVVGTGFDVVRDALGTAVRVRHGRVRVDCANGGSVRLDGGQEHTCLPRTASGMLGRARALQDRGAPSAEVLGAVDGGLTLAGPGPVRDELRFLELSGLLAAGRPDAARPVAAELLAVPGNPRRIEVTRIALALAVLQPDCPAARPLADALVAAGQDSGDVSLDAFRERCPAEAPPITPP